MSSFNPLQLPGCVPEEFIQTNYSIYHTIHTCFENYISFIENFKIVLKN